MAFYMFYTFLLLGKTLFLRIKNLKLRKIEFRYFKSYQGSSIPEDCLIHGRHFDNQFQVPVFFLITCLLVIVLKDQGMTQVILAWAFCVSRIIHSFIHLGYNGTRHRAMAYALGWIILMSMWVNLL